MIRRAEEKDYKQILEIYADARAFMREHGNPTQWGDGKPSAEQIEEDIREGNLFVWECENSLCGCFYFHIGNDPTYEIIREGSWPDECEYGVIHRIAAAKGSHGLLSKAVNYASHQIDCLRIDTHNDNLVMQSALAKYGFVRCGIIVTDDGTDRIAYQRNFTPKEEWYTDRMGNSICLRPIRARDNAKVAAIIRECLVEYGGDHRCDTAWADPYLDRFSEVYINSNNAYWVAERDGEVVAGVGIGPLLGTTDVCELQKMYCLKPFRGSGIANRLIETALAFAEKQYNRCYLETMDNMDRAKAFYEKYGFVHTAETIGCTGHCGCNYHYVKELS